MDSEGGTEAVREVQGKGMECQHDWRGIDTGSMCAECGTVRTYIYRPGTVPAVTEGIKVYRQAAEQVRELKGDSGAAVQKGLDDQADGFK